jgi:hypothetical protein
MRGLEGFAMDRRWVMGTGPFALLIIAASCGSSSSNPNTPGGEDAASSSSGGSASSSSSSGSSGAGSGGGSGSSSGSSSSGSGSSSGTSSSGADGSAGEGGTTVASSADVPQMHKNINRDGLFVDSAFTETALMGKTIHLDSTFDGTISGNVYASPLYVQDGVSHKGTFYIATESNNLYALDETTGKSSIPTKNAGFAAGSTGCGLSNISPLGITGTPAIDPATRLIVFSSATATAMNGGLSKHIIHAWSIDDFSEKWSLDVSTLTDSVVGAFPPATQNQRSAVLIVNGTAYVVYGGHYGDCSPYHGWIVGVPLNATPATVASVAKFYATPASLAGMWAAGGPSSDGTDIFDATGNSGDLDKTGVIANWKGAYSVLRWGAGPVFTPGSANFWHAVSDDSGGDDDLGGSAPLVVDATGITPSKLLVQLGKDGYAYTIDRTNMGGEMSPVSNMHVMNGNIINAAAWATTPTGTFVAMVANGSTGAGCKKGSGNLVVISLSGTAQISSAWCANGMGNGSPSITSSDGTHDIMVWTVGAEGSGQLHAWDLASGTQVVTGSDAMTGTRRFTTPIFVHGRVIAAADNKVYAFKP